MHLAFGMECLKKSSGISFFEYQHWKKILIFTWGIPPKDGCVIGYSPLKNSSVHKAYISRDNSLSYISYIHDRLHDRRPFCDKL